MKRPSTTWKTVVATFLLAVVFYVLAWSWMKQRQTGKGPWQVDFSTNSAGVPQLTIAEPQLGISNVAVQFAGEHLASTNGTGAVSFAKPKMPVPFCEVIYDDLMFQPGVVTLDCFGHLVEMAPRALGLNGAGVPWTNGTTHVLSSTNKMPAEVRKKLKGGYRITKPQNPKTKEDPNPKPQ